MRLPFWGTHFFCKLYSYNFYYKCKTDVIFLYIGFGKITTSITRKTGKLTYCPLEE